ncbi:MAG: hypothetical protein ACLU8W_10385 [Clostridia bacterium]
MDNTALSQHNTSESPLSLIRKKSSPESSLIELPEKELTIRQNLTYFSRRFSSSSVELEKRIGYICKVLNLYGFIDHKYAACSVTEKFLAQRAQEWIDSETEI